jgi:hypothetical protein
MEAGVEVGVAGAGVAGAGAEAVGAVGVADMRTWERRGWCQIKRTEHREQPDRVYG